MSEEHVETSGEKKDGRAQSTTVEESKPASDIESLESLEQLDDFIKSLDKATIVKKETPTEEQLEGVESEKEYQDMNQEEQEKYGL